MIEPVSIYYDYRAQPLRVGPGKTKYHLLVLVTQGLVKYTVEERSYDLVKGDMLYIPIDTMRQVIHERPQPNCLYVAHFQLKEPLEPLPLLNEPQQMKVTLHNFDYMLQRFLLLTQYWLQKPPHYGLLCHSVILEMITLFGNGTGDQQMAIKQNLIAQIKEYIVQHCKESIDLKRIAAHVSRSPNYISALFKQQTGQTLTSYIQEIRIAVARELLFNTQMTIGEIAQQLGFCEPSHFNKVFRKITGMPPSAFQRNKQSDRWSPLSPR